MPICEDGFLPEGITRDVDTAEDSGSSTFFSTFKIVHLVHIADLVD